MSQIRILKNMWTSIALTPEQAVEHSLVKEIETEYRHKRQSRTFGDMNDAFMLAQI